MIEMIKEDSCFTTIVDGQEYRCRVSCKFVSLDTKITLFVEKIVRSKFLFIDYYKTEWEYAHYLGTNKIFDIFGKTTGDKIPFEWINHTRYFEPDVIKAKIPLAIDSYLYELRRKEKDKIKAANIKHKKVL